MGIRLETKGEKRAREAGENGYFLLPRTIGEQIAYFKGKEIARKKAGNTGNSGELIRFIIYQIFHNSAYVFLGYKTTTLAFFGTIRNYWPSDSLFDIFKLLAITPLVAFFYVALADSLRTKMLGLKAGKNEKWKIISKALFVTDVAGPSVLAFYVSFKIGINFFKGGVMFDILALLIAVSIAVLFFDYLKKQFDERAKDDERRIEAQPIAAKSNAEYIPEGHLYPERDGGLTGVFIFFAIVIAIIMYLNSHS